MTKENDDDLFFVYCPNCKRIINAVSWKLLEQALSVTVQCGGCNGFVQFTYDGETVSIEND